MEMTTIVLLLLVPLAVWRIYSRLKIVLGRTKSELWRHYATLGVMVFMLLAVAVQTFGNWTALARWRRAP